MKEIQLGDGRVWKKMYLAASTLTGELIHRLQWQAAIGPESPSRRHSVYLPSAGEGACEALSDLDLETRAPSEILQK